MPDMDTGFERHRTDQGLTGDKIRVSDPAAAPVQTDAEAGGTATSRAAVMASITQLMENSLKTPRPDVFGAWRQPDATHQKELGRLLLVWTLALCVLGILAGWAGWPGNQL